jgi:hypothetical protein
MRRNSLQGNLYYSGNSDFGKEQSHENGFVSTDIKKFAAKGKMDWF